MSSKNRYRYKQAGMDSSEMRKQREEEGIRLRKQNRQELLAKRRNVLENTPGTSAVGDNVNRASDAMQDSEIHHQLPHEFQSKDDLDAIRHTADSQMQFQPLPSTVQLRQHQHQHQHQHQQQQETLNRTITNAMIDGINSDDESTQLEATRRILKLLSDCPIPPIKEIVQKGLVPRFVQFLKNKNNFVLQLAAAWALINIAKGASHEPHIVIDSGSVPIFIDLLLCSHVDVQAQAAWALGSIAIASPAYRDYLLDSGIMEPLLSVIHTTEHLTTLQNAVWTLSTLCYGKHHPVDLTKIVDGIPTLAKLLNHTATEVLEVTCWTLSYLTGGPNNKKQAIIDAGVCRRLVELLMHPERSVLLPALVTVGNIAFGDDVCTQLIIDCNALPCISALLTYPSKTIKKEAFWIISNITASNRHQIQAVIDANIIPILLSTMRTADFNTKKAAALAIANATSSGSAEQIHYLVRVGCIPRMCDLIMVVDSDAVQLALRCLENILKAGESLPVSQKSYAMAIEECGGLDKIQCLQSHENPDIYQQSVEIIEKYFSSEKDYELVAPFVEGDQCAFNMDMEEPQVSFNF